MHTSSELSVLLAARSAYARRNWRNWAERACEYRLDIREASTLHAIKVLLGEAGAALVVTEDDIADGDAFALASAIRACGHGGQIVMATRNTALAAGDRRRWPGGVEIAARAMFEQVLGNVVGALALADEADTGKEPAAYAHAGMIAPAGDILPFRMAERQIIETAICRFDGNIGKAARALEISPSTIYRKMQSWQEEAGA